MRSKEEFDEKVNKSVKYGFLLGFLMTVTVVLLDYITGAHGKVVGYGIVVISLFGFVLALIAVIEGLRFYAKKS